MTVRAYEDASEDVMRVSNSKGKQPSRGGATKSSHLKGSSGARSEDAPLRSIDSEALAHTVTSSSQAWITDGTLQLAFAALSEALLTMVEHCKCGEIRNAASELFVGTTHACKVVGGSPHPRKTQR
jgi:hypothetical protein